MQSPTTERSINLADAIRHYLQYHQLSANLSGISYEILALQLLDSIEQSNQIKQLVNSRLGGVAIEDLDEFVNPNSPNFDPIKAVVSLTDIDYDEACWLCFLMIYTDDSAQRDWSFIRLLYQGTGLDIPRLNWEVVNTHSSLHQEHFEKLSSYLAQINPKPKFGHHRAYESLAQLPAVFDSYIRFINEQGGHKALFKPTQTNKTTRLERQAYFKGLYSLIRQNIYRFGRLSTFEYLCLLGKMGLADIEPDSCYIAEASGPKRGAKLLFGMLNNEQLDRHAIGLADYLGAGYQEVEAAICHWQKSPNRYIQHE